MSEQESFEEFDAWWASQETGLGVAHKFTAWNGWIARAAIEADRAQRVPDGWVLIATDAYEAGFGKGEQAHKTGKDVENPWGDEPGREAWAMGYALGKERAASTPAPAQQEPSIAAEFDVRKIMVSVSPGEDGMGHEVYATSVADVENLLTSMGQELEEWQLGIRRYSAQHQEQPQQERGPMTDELLAREAAAAEVSAVGLCDSHFADGFVSGFRRAERHHGIKE